MKKIIIKRKWAYSGAALNHNITIDGYENIKLSCGSESEFFIEDEKQEIELDIKSGTTVGNFIIKKAQKISEIILKSTFSDIKCTVIYSDSHVVDLGNKKSGANSIILVISLVIIIFVLFAVNH
ncbi:MAG: hypothetical protein K2X04_11725 [Burkholderiales bacterium]|nr:hypothetical protein [Burkholderiales bacterium]